MQKVSIFILCCIIKRKLKSDVKLSAVTCLIFLTYQTIRLEKRCVSLKAVLLFSVRPDVSAHTSEMNRGHV